MDEVLRVLEILEAFQEARAKASRVESFAGWSKAEGRTSRLLWLCSRSTWQRS